MSAQGPGASARVGELVRDEPPVLDDLHRARLERRFLEAVAARADAAAGGEVAAAPPAGARRPARVRAIAGLSVLGVAAAAAALGALALREPTPSYTIERARGGEIAAGTVFEVGAGEEARAEIFDLTLAASAGAHVRFHDVRRDEIRLELSRGEVRLAFHPEERGREHVTIETPSARVEIVGTELSVRVEADGTRVAVTEGRVRVVPADGGEPVLVSANESVRVGAPAAREVTSEVRGDGRETLGDGVLEGETARVALPGEALGEADAEDATPLAAGEADAEDATPLAAGEADAEDATPLAAGEGVLALPTGAPAEVARGPDPTLSPRDRLDRAEVLLDSDPSAARSELRALCGPTSPRAVRVDAHNLLGDSFAAAHDAEAALREYAEAARLGRGTASGATAIYDGARLSERTGDSSAAREGYERYLREYPDGANAVQARSRLDALGGAGGR